MKKLILSIFASVMMCSTSFAVQPELTDLPFAYGGQLKNSTFEGAWTNYSNSEPADNSWHSFGSATNAGGLTTVAISTAQSGASSDVRPGSTGTQSGMTRSRSVIIATANGNLTTGRIHAGSTTAANLTGNYNRTVRNDENFATPFTSKPDSISVWVKLTTNNDNNHARMSVLLHDGSTDCQDAPSREADRNSIAGFAEARFNRVGGWKRLSVPFQYDQYTSFSNFSNSSGSQTYTITPKDPEYILVTFSTNERAGSGTTSDVLLIDDILMIYNPILAVNNTSEKSRFLAGEEIKISYTITGTMSPYNLNAEANVVRLELSDETGSFDNAIVLDEVTTDENGVFTVNLPEAMEVGNGYKLRVVTTNYPMISEEISIEIFIPVDKTLLEAALEAASLLDEDGYTTDSWAVLASAIENGEAVLANENATQEEVDAAVTAIETAIESLDTIVVVDKTNLVTALAIAETYSEDGYTADSWAVLASAVENGEAVLANENATQEEVDAAVTAIETAIENLVVVNSANDTTANPAEVTHCFSVIGVQINCDTKGIVIKKYADGEVKKEFVK